VFSWLLSDYVKVSNIATDQMLYTEKDIEASMDRIETVNFHQETEVGGVKFWCYNAGHVLGAAMFMIEIAGVKVCELMCILCTTMSCDNMTHNKLIFAIICFITFCVIFGPIANLKGHYFQPSLSVSLSVCVSVCLSVCL